MLRTPVPSLPITMAPHLTLSSAVWLLPALAVLVGITRLGFFKPSRTAWAVIAGTSAGVLLGALQMASGGSEDSPWYLYRINNNGVATGFFANANHMATLLVVSVPFIAALLVSSRKKYSKAQWSAIVVALGGALAVVVLGIMLNRSLAGMGLIIATGVASYVMAKPTGPMPKRVLALLPLLFIATAGLVYSGAVDQDMTADAKSSVVPRQAIFSNSIKAARDFFPVGSGIGTFAEIYPAYENPKAVTRTYINHAHNDYIEIVLEMGLPGAVLLVLFLLWWLTRTLQIWRSDNRDHYACAATIASGAILAHSLVDYPLRTAAIAAVFAACCALMSEPHSLVRPGRRGRVKTKARHLSVDAH
jgi:O-antigen ligase